MSDGKIIFSTRIDNSQVEKDLKATQKKIRDAEKSSAKAEEAKLPLTKQAEELGVALDMAKAKLEQLKAESASISAAMQPGAAPETYIDAYARRDTVAADLKAQEKEVGTLQKKWDGIVGRIEGYDAKIKEATAAIQANKATAGQLEAKLSKGGINMSGAFDKAAASAHHFGKRLGGIVSSALVFSFIYRGIHKVIQAMGQALKQNDEYRAQLAQLKGALLTAFQPFYELILPAVLAVMRVITAIVSVVANVLSLLGGKTIKQSSESAKALKSQAAAYGEVGSAAKKASKDLASFDEINKLGEEDTGGFAGGGGGGMPEAIEPDFSAFNTDEYKKKIDELTVYMSGALLALGAILAFSGANIPLGIGLMVAGAIGLAAMAKENWGAMSDELKKAFAIVGIVVGGAMLAIGAVLAFSGIAIARGIALMAIGAATLATASAINWDSIKNALKGPVGKVTALVSVALVALGAILAFSGVALPLGIALMATGAAGLATVVAVNWDTMKNALQGPIGKVFAIGSVAFLVLGLVLAFSGVALPLGIALIAAGAVGLVTVSALNWNAITEKVKGVWGDIKSWWKTYVAPVFTVSWWKNTFSSIVEGLKSKAKDAVNAAISIFNRFISWINEKMKFSWDSLNLFGKEVIPAGGFTLLRIPTIPYLAKGAVLPANKPFLSVVGDQKNGTNVEAPLATIQEALINALEQYGGAERDINIKFTGDLAQLARILKPVIETENKRIGPSLVRG